MDIVKIKKIEKKVRRNSFPRDLRQADFIFAYIFLTASLINILILLIFLNILLKNSTEYNI